MKKRTQSDDPSRNGRWRFRGSLGAGPGKPSVLDFLVLTALAGCLALLSFSWLGHRSLQNSAQAATSLNRITAQISDLQSLLQTGPLPPEDSLGTTLQILRQDLNNVISGPGCTKAVQEILVRADTLMTQAQRALARRDLKNAGFSIDQTETVAQLGEASRLLIATSLQLRSEVNRHHKTGHLRLIISFLLGGLAFAAMAFQVSQLMKRESNGLVSDSAAFPLLLAAAVRNTDEGVLITDTGMQIGEPMILFANDSFKDMSGFPDRDLIGQPLRMLRTTCLREKEFSLLEHSYSNSKSATMETIRWQDDGSKVYCEWHISPVREDDGKVTHFISILMDVTRLREQEEAQRRSKEELMEAHQRLMENQQQLIHSEKMAFLGQLAAGVAHEINNPVGYVMSNLETLSDDIEALRSKPLGQPPVNESQSRPQQAPFFDETQEILQESISGLDRVKDIVQGLKNFARPAEAKTENADINHEVEVALKIVSNELGGKCAVQKNLGALPTLDCRPGQLNQVFANLLANAAHAITKHGTITVTTEFTGSEILVKIADDGIGIEEEDIPRLFAPFFTTKPTGQGTGLGLSVSYGIIQTHNGTIEVESTLGKGSTFIVRLPTPPEDNN